MFKPFLARYIHNLILEGIRQRAGEVLLRHDDKEITVRYRIGNKWFYVPSPPRRAQSELFQGIKEWAGLSDERAPGSEKGVLLVTLLGKVLDLPVTLRRDPDGETITIQLTEERPTGRQEHT
jgi:type II secretory ATPase GspE/PulE/Tfp pilus assembly ATPase PilB-like protein